MQNRETGVTVICGHYGSGKTNLTVNLAVEAAQAGQQVTVVDLDLVNPYFCSFEHGPLFARMGIALTASPSAGTNLDAPFITAAVDGALAARRRVFVDLGGDDAGATVLGRYAAGLMERGYEMLYVINRYRVLSQSAAEAAALLKEIETASRLRATALVNNSHLGVETKAETVQSALAFAQEVRDLTGLPLLYSTTPDFAPVPGFKTVRRYVQFPWENAFPG